MEKNKKEKIERIWKLLENVLNASWQTDSDNLWNFFFS